MNAKLRTVLSLALVLALLITGGSAVLAAERLVDERAELDLMPKVEGAEGEAEVRLRIDEDGMLELFRIKVDAEGLVPGGTYTLWYGRYLIATDTADDNGTISFDELVEEFHPETLVGGKIKVIYGTTMEDPVVLFGKIMETDLVKGGLED
ncbi:MAG: hypothetical protein HYX91_01840 [Chloroflexi bacterium]|nr:hypothetical protein [Chloroflexota bacterium]